MPQVIPCDGDKIVLISPEGIEYPGTIEKIDSIDLYVYKINSSVGSFLTPGWRIKLEEEDRDFTNFSAFLTTDRSR